MDGTLSGEAVVVQDIAAALQLWLDRTPAYATHISASMSELLEIGVTLCALDEASNIPACDVIGQSIEEELRLILQSLSRSLVIVKKMLGSSGLNGYLSNAICGQSWEALHARFRVEGPTLHERLEQYRVYLQALLAVIQGYPPNPNMALFHSRIQFLLAKQDTIDPSAGGYPAASADQWTSFYRHGFTSSSSRPPPQSQMNEGWEYPTPPVAPDVPPSPTVSNTSTQTYSSGQTYSTTSSFNSSNMRHWATRILDGRHSATRLRGRATATACYGNVEPAAEQRLQAEGFVRVMQLPFEYTEVTVQLFWRPADYRARILYLTIDKRTSRPSSFCYPLTSLIVRRDGTCLKLGRLNNSGRLEPWANLRFDVYERMILFYCTFVALKRQDQMKPSQDVDDYIQPGEIEEFGGEIKDGQLKHALRIFCDEDSGGVRIEVTARRGPMAKVPIWTSFILNSIKSRYWVQKSSSRAVRFTELQPYVFCDNYLPTKDARGRFEILFTSRADADGFMSVIEGLRRG